jgi:hypothetical protein
MTQEKATINGEVYLLVVSPQPAEDNTTSCVGCAFDNYNEDSGVGCAEVVKHSVPTCRGNIIFIKDTPNAIAEWVEARLK